jgi:large subunit ribosomal protein L29
MKINEIRKKDCKELQTILFDFKKEAFNLRFQVVSGSVSKTDRIRYVKTSIAQIKTILKARELKLEVVNA